VLTWWFPAACARLCSQTCKKLGRYDLSDCTMYASCEPCPMCFGAIQAAKIKGLVYGVEAEAALKIGFDDFIADGVRGTTVQQRAKVTIKKASGKSSLKAEEIFMNVAGKFNMTDGRLGN